ncbi:TPA: hypothetical protein MB355_005001, partial [Klebsiella quasipneumoniae subsp. similipneumoniae]
MSISKRNFLKAVSCACFFYSFKALTKDNRLIEDYIPAKGKNTWPNKVHRVEEFYTSNDRDYSDAIAKAINYCSSNNCVLLFSDKYKISRSIILQDNTYIMGKEGSLLY